jgi:hypothetical protein
MNSPPSLSQRPQSFHPDFDREVYMIVFSVSVTYYSFSHKYSHSIFKVEGQGFKVDASRLTAHSYFLCKMLFDSDGHLGTSGEGLVDNPIVVAGCTARMFANFLGWLNHK